MLASSVGLVVVYLVFGLLISVLARKGWTEDWEEGLLASVLGPPLFTLIAAAVVARFLWTHLAPSRRGPKAAGWQDEKVRVYWGDTDQLSSSPIFTGKGSLTTD
jgi:hypothetical protein